ncbi:MAG: methyltransferase domain-containing protein [Opitutales bacterium]|nr:methyltransferase domain-containing protein [Opitutales bacterium]MCH8540015.1 TPMT family class I SAM-dependent methyltransferase [Opitutales bacterium]
MSRDWEKAYAEEDTPWDKGYAAPPLEEFLRQHRVSGRVLVPGCGTGHDVRALAAQGAEVVGMDIAPGAIRKAGAFPQVGSERYEVGDFLDLKATHRAAYDWVFEHTCLCALPPEKREVYFQSVRAALKPGGYYWAVFFREVSDYTGEGPPHPISREETDALLGNDFELLASFVPQETYPSRPVGAEEVVWLRLKGS